MINKRPFLNRWGGDSYRCTVAPELSVRIQAGIERTDAFSQACKSQPRVDSVGARGLGALRSALPGSVSKGVLHAAKVPGTTVKHAGAIAAK